VEPGPQKPCVAGINPRPADAGEDLGAGLGATLEGGPVDRDQPKFRAVPLQPLEVVEAGPVEIAAYVGAVAERLHHRPEVVGEEPRTQLVILVGDAVLGDPQRQPQLLPERDQGPPQTGGVDAPAEAAARQRRIRVGADEEAGGGASVEAHPFLGVVVEPQVVEGAAGLEEVGAGLAGGWIWWPSLVGWPSVDGVHVPVFFLPGFSAAGVSHTSPSASPSERGWPLRREMRQRELGSPWPTTAGSKREHP
jgi:hypothetical protein